MKARDSLKLNLPSFRLRRGAQIVFLRAVKMIEHLKRTDFVPHLNSKFRMALANAKVPELELIEVHEGIKSPVQEAFALVFRAALEAPRLAQMFTLEHAVLGTLPLFLSPFRVDSDGLYYEAVFNRLVTK